jgi:hypothetical protein
LVDGSLTHGTVIRDAFFDAADTAAALLGDPAVAAAWDRPSGLAKFSVRGLAGHLARQVTRTIDAIASSSAVAGMDEPVTLLGHYAQVRWIGADLDGEVNAGIRAASEDEAAGGPDALVARTREAIGQLRGTIAAAPADALVRVPQGWSLRLDDFLVTRMMEIAVHNDDLAVSVGIDTPDLPPAVMEPVFDLLLQLSVRRRGVVPVLRALTRIERAPGSITAF